MIKLALYGIPPIYNYKNTLLVCSFFLEEFGDTFLRIFGFGLQSGMPSLNRFPKV